MLGDQLSLWIIAKLGMSELWNPGTDWLKIWHEWLYWGGNESCQILYEGRIYEVLALGWQTTPIMGMFTVTWHVFRSILRQSRPNKVGLKCPSMHTPVRPQQVSWILMKFGTQVEVDEWCTTVCSVTWSKVRVTSPSSWKSGRFQKLSRPLFTMGAGSWPRIPKLKHNL